MRCPKDHEKLACEIDVVVRAQSHEDKKFQTVIFEDLAYYFSRLFLFAQILDAIMEKELQKLGVDV